MAKETEYKCITQAKQGLEAACVSPSGRLLTRRSFLKLASETAVLGAAGLLLTGCKSEKGDEIFKGVRKITDDAGRELSIPTASNIHKVYFTSALAEVFVLTLAPDLMGATCSRYTAEEKKYLPDNIGDLVYLGSVETGEMDVEAVMAEGIEIIFSISSIELTGANISEAEDIQNKSGIPVVLIDGSFEKIKDAYSMLGDILGREDRSKKLCDYCEKAYSEVQNAVKDIAEEDKVTVYYAEGPKGLQTEPSSSQHAYSFNAAGGKVVAEVELFDATGMADVSLESVIKWNPEVIVAWDEEIRGGADNLIRTSSDWSSIKAVKDGRVYTMPNVPVAWLDRPMACNRYLGIQWLANMFYPDKFNVDMVEVGKEYYELFFGKKIADDEMKKLLGNSYPATSRVK